MKLLTVAVPAYNAERYLNKCLESLCQEEYRDRLDIIVINDGSKDGTSEIAHSFQDRFPDTVEVVDKENGGHGSGINTAIIRARGKYFQVIDSDDWVNVESMPTLLDQLEQVSADMVICNYHMVDMATGKQQPFRTKQIPLGVTYSFADFMSYPKGARDCCFFHGIIYRTDFYRDTGIRLSEKIYYEDQEYATIPAYYAQTVLPLDLFIYQYMVGNSEQSISNENQIRYMGQIETVFWNICDFYCAHREMPEEKKQYFLFKMSTLLLSYYVAGLMKDWDRNRGRLAAEKMRESVRRKCPELFEYSRKKYKIAQILGFLHVSPALLEEAKRTKIYHVIRKFI